MASFALLHHFYGPPSFGVRRQARVFYSFSPTNEYTATLSLVRRGLAQLRGVALDEASGDLGGQEDAGEARAGVGASARDVEAAHILGAVVRAEVGRLEEGRFDLPAGAEIRPQFALEVQW